MQPRQNDTSSKLDLLHMDEHVVAVNKPCGLPAVPGRTPELADCVWTRLQVEVNHALVVHRLDIATSGVMVFARHLQAQRALGWAFEQRRVAKHYVALVHGLVALDEGVVDAALRPDWDRRPLQVVDHVHGRAATTRFVVLRRKPRAKQTLVRLEPQTGRSHQLRVHMSMLGHPIVGDDLYGSCSVQALMNDVHASRASHSWRASRPSFHALCLHAHVLGIPDLRRATIAAPQPVATDRTWRAWVGSVAGSLQLQSPLPAWATDDDELAAFHDKISR